MTNSVKTRSMSPKGFLHKTTTKAAANAAGFLAQHREWLQTGQLAELTAPVLTGLDEKTILPTPALEQIKKIVLDYHLASEIAKAAEAMVKSEESSGGGSSKNYIATIYNSKGEVQTRIDEKTGKEKELSQGFDSEQAASGWCDRRLFDGAPDWFGVVESQHVFRNDGSSFTTTVLRNDAIGRILKAPKGAVMKRQKKATGRLSFGVKTHPSRASFSHG